MIEKLPVFDRARPRLQGIAYRMLGSMADAEEVVQDVWIRWNATPDPLENPEAWLVTVTTRLSIDRLRLARTEREHYVGLWLPEPVLSDGPPTPDEILERSDDISIAFLTLLERLTPEARAAFVLRDLFEADYQDLAETLGRSEASCRQLVHRAREQLRDTRARRPVPAEVHLQLLRSFSEAMAQGDRALLNAMLAEDAQLLGDGGAKVRSLGRALTGGARIAMLFFAARRRHGAALRIELAFVNGQWALLRYIHGTLDSCQSYQTDGQRITDIHVQRNPDKLARLIGARPSTHLSCRQA